MPPTKPKKQFIITINSSNQFKNRKDPLLEMLKRFTDDSEPRKKSVGKEKKILMKIVTLKKRPEDFIRKLISQKCFSQNE